MFSTEANREGIQVGTAVALLVKQGATVGGQVLHRDFWGVAKREALLGSLDAADFDASYARTLPSAANRFSLRVATSEIDYGSWAALPGFPVFHRSAARWRCAAARSARSIAQSLLPECDAILMRKIRSLN